MATEVAAKAVKKIERDFREYVVTATAITMKVGRDAKTGKALIRRFKQRARLRLDADTAQTRLLVSSKLIAEIKEGAKLKAATAAIVTKALGAHDDPAKPPLAEFLPIKPSANQVADLSE